MNQVKISFSQKLLMAIRFLRRRGPLAIRRRIEARRSRRKLAMRPDVEAEQISVGLLIGGVVGDTIIAARFIRDLRELNAQLVFDVYSANVNQSQWIFANVAGIRGHFQDSLFDQEKANYDFALFFSDTVSIRGVKADAENRLPVSLTEMLERLAGFSRAAATRHLSEGIISQEMVFRHSQTRATASQYMAGIPYAGPRFDLSVNDDVLRQLGLSGKKYVTIHNGFAISQISNSKSSTKSYLRFSDVIAEFRKKKTGIIFVQIGAATSVEVQGVEINLLGKTTLAQAAAIIRGATCHLDNESGFVTIASCFGVPSCVVYGPTSADYFTYPGNVVVRPVDCGGCWWLVEEWASRCPRGMAEPVCMRTQPPSAIASALIELLDNHGL